LAFPSQHPYHRPIIGYREEVADMRSEDLKNFYKKYYSPNRATLSVVGDVDLDELIPIVEEKFGKIEPSSYSRSFDRDSYFAIPVDKLRSSRLKIYKDVRNDRLTIFWTYPGYRSGLKPAITFEALSEIIAGGTSSRLFKRLVDNEKVASAVSAYAYTRYGAGIFVISVFPLDGKLEECRNIVFEELEKISKEGVSSKELLRVKNLSKKAKFSHLEDISTFTEEWVSLFVALRDEYAWFKEIEILEQLKEKDLVEAAAVYLSPQIASSVEISPVPEDRREQFLEEEKREDLLDAKVLSSRQRKSEVEPPRYLYELGEPNRLEFSFPKPDLVFDTASGLKSFFLRTEFSPTFYFFLAFKHGDTYSASLERFVIRLMVEMLDEGSLDHSMEENREFFENRGATLLFSTKGISLSGFASDFEELIGRLDEIISRPAFSEESLEKLKRRMLNLIERKMDSEREVASRLVRQQLFTEDSYGWSFEDAISSVKELSIEKVKELYSMKMIFTNFYQRFHSQQLL
jgi:zinc protease